MSGSLFCTFLLFSCVVAALPLPSFAQSGNTSKIDLREQLRFYNETAHFHPESPVDCLANGDVAEHSEHLKEIDDEEIRQNERDDISPIPERPSSVGAGSFHVSQFENLKENGYAPAVDAMPVFLFSRTQPIYQPCYPESATVIGSNPTKMNPGTDQGWTSNPGTNCNDPGPYHGAYSLGNRFPVYVTAVYCPTKDEWRINYNLYYVHDGLGIGALIRTGHRHDWESVTVVWKRDTKTDWYHRAGAFFTVHDWRDWFQWSDLHTVDIDLLGPSDVSNDTIGMNRKHPKCYVGFFSHANFPNKDDKSRQTQWNEVPYMAGAYHLLHQEYRSDDWWRLPRVEDIRPGDEIDPSWNYHKARSTPSVNMKEMCGW